jgi:uncharacterized membrane protein YheB (UPF0754 family)
LPPLVGGVIGYVTNWIAVKMLFRPLYPKYIGKWQLPFTPGIIPRRKDSLAKAIGQAVGSQLLTKEDIGAAFCGEDKKNVAVNKLTDAVWKGTDKEIREIGSSALTPQGFQDKLNALSEKISSRAVVALSDMQIGETVANIAEAAVLEKIKGSPLSMFVSRDLVHSVASSMSDKIDEYISEHGKEKIQPVIDGELNKLSAQPLKGVLDGAEIDRTSLSSAIGKIYDQVLLPAVGEIVSSFDIAAQVEKKISEMDVKDLEKLCLSVMKKELNAITWLGGLIGLLLGIVNIFL